MKIIDILFIQILKERTKSKDFSKKIKSFDIEYLKIDDFKIENIFKKIEKGFFKVRKTSKPIFIEIDTMRTCGHVGPENDDAEFNYRKDELVKWKNKNSAEYFKKKVLKYF